MYSTSKAFDSAMNEYIRNRANMRVSLGVVNIEAQQSGAIQGDLAEWSNKNFPFTNNEVTGEYATMEHNLFKVDGSMYFMPNDGVASYFSNMGVATKNLLGTITISLNKAYDIKGLTLDFGEFYPTKFTITTNGNTKTYTNTSSTFVTTDTFNNVSSFVITPTTMVGGQQRLRINGITFGTGISFDDTTIMSATFKESVNAVCEELPSTTFEITVNDEKGVFNVDDDNSFVNFLETGQVVNCSVGLELEEDVYEYVPLGTLALQDWKSNGKQMSFTATDNLAFMDEIYSDGNTIHSRTLYADAQAVLEDYGFQADQYVLDECLKDVTITNPLPECSYAECLQMIANAGRCVVTQARDGRIVIRANFATVIDPEDYTVTTTSQAEWSKPNNIMVGSSYVYADMTSNMFSADGTMFFMPQSSASYLQTSFVSRDISNSNGNFATNPNFSIKLPAGYVYYGIYLDFDGQPPKEVQISTTLNNNAVETFTYSELSKHTLITHEFLMFDKITFTFTKAEPNSRVAVNKASFGDLTDYSLRYDDMLENPIGYREKKTRSVDVKIFTFTEDSEGKPVEQEDSVFYTETLNLSGKQVTFENPLISTEAHAKDIAEWLGNYYKNNVAYDVTFRGDPRLNASDIIHMESSSLDNLQVSIENITFTYNGAFGGTLALRRALKMT